MQIDLYDPDITRKIQTSIEQIKTRQYKIAPKYADLAGLDQYFSNPVKLENYKSSIWKAVEGKRHYSNIGMAACDNLFDIEALGIGTNASEYTLICDFSECLDYILHKTCLCDMEAIRSIEDYKTISKAILNCDFNAINTDYTFEKLISVSPELQNYILHISSEVKKDASVSTKDQVSWIVYTMYREWLSNLQMLKFYVTYYICKYGLKNPSNNVIRSYSYSAVVASIGQEFEDSITLHSISGKDPSKYSDYKINVRTYKPYEYAGEVLRRNEFSKQIYF